MRYILHCSSYAEPSAYCRAIPNIGRRYNAKPHEMSDRKAGVYIAVNMPRDADAELLRSALLAHAAQERAKQRERYKAGVL